MSAVRGAAAARHQLPPTSRLPAIDDTPSTHLVRLVEGNAEHLLWSARMVAIIAIGLLIVMGLVLAP